MIKHVIRTMLTITVACSAVGVCHAGVITVVGGVVTTAQLNDGSDNLNIKFTFGTYNNIKSNPPSDTMPWYQGDTSQLTIPSTSSPAYTLADDLYNAIVSDPTVNDYAAVYTFAVHAVDNAVYTFFVAYQGSEWGIGVNEADGEAFHADQTSPVPDSPFGFFYASLDTGGNSNVPEPSTAIAMGLLGIVGFAGNRRRRTALNA